jgi:Family of unknown function (DUF6278)
VRPALVAWQPGGENGSVRNRWRAWLPGPRHGLARGVLVYGVPRHPDPQSLAEHLGRCDRLRTFARDHGFELEGSPHDLGLLDRAIGEATDPAQCGPSQAAALAEAGLFLGSVIVATVAGARWRLWPNGHPVVRLSSGRDLDVTVLASDRVGKGAPLLADVYADAAAGPTG